MPKPRRSKQRQQRRQEAMAHGLARWRAQDSAARLAVPTVNYSPPPGAMRHRITIESAGAVTVIEASEPIGRARSDQMAVAIDGAPCDRLHGLTALLGIVSRYLPRQPSRRQVREAEIADAWGYRGVP